jgi:hypothetical protein
MNTEHLREEPPREDKNANDDKYAKILSLLEELKAFAY